MKYAIKTITLFSLSLLLGFNIQAQTACTNDGARQLDFMLGDWDFFSKEGELLGENNIRLVFGTYMIEENYEGSDGLKTRSVMSYDVENKNWSQIWTDDFGTTLHFYGKFENNKLSMKAVSINTNGKKTYHRLTYSKSANGSVSQVWQKSTNKKDWNMIFRGTFKRQKAVL